MKPKMTGMDWAILFAATVIVLVWVKMAVGQELPQRDVIERLRQECRLDCAFVPYSKRQGETNEQMVERWLRNYCWTLHGESCYIPLAKVPPSGR